MMKLNLWKPLALVSMSALALVAAYPNAWATPAPTPAPAVANQPNMEAALNHLREARSALDRAEHDKGGWRTKAIGATDNALRETQRGIAFGDTH